MPTPTSSPEEMSPSRTSTDTPPAPAWAGIPVFSGLVPPPPTPADVAEPGGSSRVTTTVKTEMPRRAVAGTGASKGKQEWTPTPVSPGRRDASGVPPDVASSQAFMSLLESLCEELRADMAGAVETLTAERTPGRLASPSAGMGPSGNRVVTGGGGGDCDSTPSQPHPVGRKASQAVSPGGPVEEYPPRKETPKRTHARRRPGEDAPSEKQELRDRKFTCPRRRPRGKTHASPSYPGHSPSVPLRPSKNTPQTPSKDPQKPSPHGPWGQSQRRPAEASDIALS